jgi:hypothetical protein
MTFSKFYKKGNDNNGFFSIKLVLKFFFAVVTVLRPSYPSRYAPATRFASV